MTETDRHRQANHLNRFEKHPRITILAVILIFTIICAGVFSFVYFQRLQRHQTRPTLFDAAFTYRRSSPVYHHDFRKNQVVPTAAWGDRRYPLYTNSLGFKDSSPRQVPLTSAAYRLIFMGDSFTEGIGLAYQDTFAGLTARRLAPCQVEVLNAAAVSYSPIIYWRKTKYLLEQTGLRFDEMVVFLDISDVRDEAESYYLDEKNRVQSRLFEDKQTRQAIIDRIRKEGAVDSMARFMGILQSYALPPYWDTGKWTIDRDLYQQVGKPGLRRMDNYMTRLKNLLDRHGIKLTVAVYPWPPQLRAGDRDSVHSAYWRNWCRRQGVEFIDYFPVFFETMGETPPKTFIDRYFINGDAHWNRQGHQLVADIFCQRFLSRRPCQPNQSPAKRKSTGIKNSLDRETQE
ncbi:MAG: hypothetical protein R6U29_04650 [Desulfosudaceae bacterium]